MSEDSRNELLQKIRQYNFAAYDMLLYLDTHPKDKKAFEMYRELTMMYVKLLNEYQASYGPLTIEGAAMLNEFRWYENPWPWDKQTADRCIFRKEC